MSDTGMLIRKVTDSMISLLLYKNKKYGDSAIRPMQIFSKVDAEQQILNRLDDKLSRIKNSSELRKNDVSDLIGYLILLCVSKGWDDFKEMMD